MKRFLALFLWLILLVPLPALAQAGTSLASLEVDLWPEFDRPGVLVIYRLALPASASLPADISVRIPAAVGKPNAVAGKQTDGSLINITYQQQPAGEWSTLKFKATTPEVQVEFYDPGLTRKGVQRHFEFHWPGDYAVKSLVIQVQQPVGATEMRISPSLGSGSIGQDGLTYFTSDVGSLDAGQVFALSIDYNKTSDALSSTTMTVSPSGPINDQTAGRMTLVSALPWVLAALGLVLILGGGWLYWLSGRGKARVEPRTRHKPSTSRAEPTIPNRAENDIYCHQCGKRAGPGDRFCRTCGTELRLI